MCPCRYAAQIACVLRDEPNLTAIDVSANRLQQPTAAILQALTAHSNLTSLNLSDNGMTDEPLTCLVRRCFVSQWPEWHAHGELYTVCAALSRCRPFVRPTVRRLCTDRPAALYI